MNKLYVYAEPGSETRDGGSNESQFASATLVFQSGAGPLGFGIPAGAAGAAALQALVADAVLVERSNHPGWARGSPTASVRFIRWHASRGVVALVSATDSLMSELERADTASKTRKANEVRTRHDRPPLAVDAVFFDSWIAQGEVTANAQAFLLQTASVVAMWRHGEWGVYAKALALEPDGLLQWIKRAQADDTMVVTCATANELPTW